MDNEDRIIIRPKQAEQITGLGRVSLWRKEKAGDFPKSIKLGVNSKGWFRDEILAWLESRRAGNASA